MPRLDQPPPTTVSSPDLLIRAQAPLSAQPRAFLRWAGSKRLVLSHLAPVVPEDINNYFEPFLGGASLFFLTQPERAVLSDSCADLIETYKAVRDNPRAVVRYLSEMRVDRDYFYSVREQRSKGRLRRAAEFIYLNKTCWNGLYRVNAQGDFNVPYGRPKTDALIDSDNLRACSRALSKPGITLTTCDFEDAVSDATEDDFVFFDPPYVTSHRDNGFVDYNHILFSWDDQRRLADVARRLRSAGCTVVITNADHASIAALYSDFRQIRFSRKSTIAGNITRRTRTTELILTGGPLKPPVASTTVCRS